MLLKCSKTSLSTTKGSIIRSSGMRMTMSTSSTMTSKIHRKGFRTPSKRYPGKAIPGKLHSMSRVGPGKIPPGKKILSRPHPPPCDNSNDSGFGFDQHLEHNLTHNPQQIVRTIPTSRSTIYHDDEISTDGSDDMMRATSPLTVTRCKRRKIDTTPTIIPDNEDACSDDIFIEKISTAPSNILLQSTPSCATATATSAPTKYYTSTRSLLRPATAKRPSQLQSNTIASSKDGKVQLEIIEQPEQQHRARYQTEGSRGAVKDRSGNGFPVVKLSGYNKPTKLEVFIGTDVGRIAPHMFYQACKVAGKNSTPCNEKKFEGTMIIEIDFKPDSDLIITCDCVGILKERNVDVEHRFPDHSAQRNKKKSTRCRMVFKTQLTLDDGTTEILQVCSQPIICTQPPGVPEICKKSLVSCPVTGGLELYVIGKNFLKDTVVIFREFDENSGQINSAWEQKVIPDKEYLQQTHLICIVPPYINQNITDPVQAEVFIMSSGKKSECHNFLYLPKDHHTALTASTTLSTIQTITSSQDGQFNAETTNQVGSLWNTVNTVSGNGATPMILETKLEIDQLMPPPTSTTVPIRRASLNGIISNESSNILQQITINSTSTSPVNSTALKTELIDENSQNSLISSEDTNMQLDNSSPTNLSQYSSNTSMSPIKELQQNQFRTIRKPSLHIIDIPTLMNEGSLQCFAQSNSNSPQDSQMTSMTQVNAADIATVVEMAVKQEQMDLQNRILMSNNITAAQPQQTAVEKFFSNLESNLNTTPTLDNQICVVPAQVSNNNILVPQTSNNFNFTQINPQITSNNNIMNTITNCNQMDQQYASNLSQQLDHPMLSINSSNENSPKLIRSSSCSSNSSTSSNSPNGFSGSNNSPPLHHDIILNSEPAAVINSINLMLPNNSNATQHSPSSQITSDLILNTSVSPSSIMCQPTVADPLLTQHQNTISNTLLNDINALNTQSSQDSISLNNIILPNHMQVEKSKQQETRNANLIIEAAADYIRNQENQERNALVESQILQNVQQVPNMQQSSNNSTIITTNQNQFNSSIVTNVQSSQQQQQHQRQIIPYNGTNIITNALMNHTNSHLINLNSHQQTQNEFMQNMHQKTNQLVQHGIINPTTESLMQTTNLDKSKDLIQVVTTTTAAPHQNSNINGSAVVTTPQPVATIPQELTTMSDQDLISYINPSTFDQV